MNLSKDLDLFHKREMTEGSQHVKEGRDVVVGEAHNSIRQRHQPPREWMDGARGTAVAFAWSAGCHGCLGSAEGLPRIGASEGAVAAALRPGRKGDGMWLGFAVGEGVART